MNENWEIPDTMRLDRVRRESGDTFTWELTRMSGTSKAFLPGQFNMLSLFGIGEVPISISGDPAHPEKVIHTTRAVGTVTEVMKRMKAGSIVGARGPFGKGWPVEEAAGSDLVIVAGGIGLAPLRPAVYSVLRSRYRYGKVVLLYGTRTPKDIVYKSELERWRARFDLDVQITVDSAGSNWHGNVGFVTSLVPRAHFDPQNAIALICGPEVMIRFAALELMARGMQVSNLYVSLERNMKCATGLCGHCQLGPYFVCKDGPVFQYSLVQDWISRGEI